MSEWPTSTPAWFDVSETLSPNELAPHESSPGSPSRTKPVAPETYTWPFTVAPQRLSAPPPLAERFPLMVEPTMTAVVPAAIVRFPVSVACVTHQLPPERVRLADDVPERTWSHAAEVDTVELSLSGLESGVVVDPEAVSEMVAPAADGLTCSTNEKTDDAPDASVPKLQDTVPAVPCAGRRQVADEPDVWDNEEKVVFAGVASCNETLSAGAGPLFLTVTV